MTFAEIFPHLATGRFAQRIGEIFTYRLKNGNLEYYTAYQWEKSGYPLGSHMESTWLLAEDPEKSTKIFANCEACEPKLFDLRSQVAQLEKERDEWRDDAQMAKTMRAKAEREVALLTEQVTNLANSIKRAADQREIDLIRKLAKAESQSPWCSDQHGNNFCRLAPDHQGVLHANQHMVWARIQP